MAQLGWYIHGIYDVVIHNFQYLERNSPDQSLENFKEGETRTFLQWSK